MKQHAAQIEFCDIQREKARPAGSGQVIGAFFVFNALSQRVDQVAYTVGCTTEHLYHQIEEGEFPNAIDIGSDTSRRSCYRIPRQDVIDWIESRKVGAR